MNRVSPLAEYNIQYLKTITKIIIIIMFFFNKTNCILCHNFLFIVYHKKRDM